MASKMMRAVVASVLVAALASTVQACTPSCPPNYEAVITDQTACGYVCQTQYKPECLPQPTFNYRTRQWQPAATPTDVQKQAAMPRVCGGTDLMAPPCPGIACGYSSSYSISGPLGCSTAGSYVNITSVSNTTYNWQNYFKDTIQSYVTNGLCVDGYSADGLVASASNASSAFATAVAKTMEHYNTYACTCCYNNNVGNTTITGAAQAVATAIADAWQQADAAVYDCNGNALSLASGNTEAVALDVELALKTVYAHAISQNGDITTCSNNCKSEMSQATAKAAACAYVSVWARAIDSVTQGTTDVCVSTYTVTGTDVNGALWSTQCKAMCS